MARKTVLVCDNCGKEVDEGKGAMMRITYTDARRGAKQADLCDDCAGEHARARRRPPRPQAEGRSRVERGTRGVRAAADRPAAASRRWAEVPLTPARRARERGQGRAPARPLSRALSTASRCSIVPNRADVDRVERDLLAAAAALLGGSIGTFDDLFDRLAAAAGRRPVATDAQRALARAPRVARGDARRARPLRRASPASPTRSLQALARARGRAARPGRARRRPRRALRAPTAPSSTGSGSGTATCVRRRAVERLARRSRRLARRAGLRLRLRGPDRRRVGAARGARRAAPTSPSRCRTSPAGRRSRRSGARPTTSRALAAGRIEELPPRYGEVAPPALAHLERRCSRTRRRARRRRSRARCASSRAPARAARSSSSARRCSRCSRGGTPPEEIALVCPSLERWRAPLETALRRARHPVRGRAASCASARRRSAARCSRCSASPGSAAAARDLFALPALAVLGLARARRRLRRGPAARARRPDARARRGGDASSCAGAAPGARRAAPARPSRSRRVRELAARDAARRLRARARRRPDEAARLDLRAHEALRRLLDELDGWRELGGRARRARTSSPRSSAPTSGSARRRRAPGGSPCSTCCARARAASRPSSCSGSRRAACRAAAAASPFLDDDARRELDERGARARAARPGRARPLPLLHGLHARLAAALPRPRGGDRRRAARASRARSGTRSAALFDAEDVERWTRRRPLSALDLAARAPRRPSASACARSPRSPRRRRRRPRRARARRTAGSAGSSRARARSAARRGSRNPLVLEQLGATHDVRRHRARALRRLLLGVALRARHLRRGRSTPRSTPSCAARSPTRRCTASSRGLPKELGAEQRRAGATSRTRVGFLRRVPRRGDRGGVRLELTDMQRRELDQSAVARPRGVRRATRRDSELPLVPRRFEVSFGIGARGAGAAARARARRRARRSRGKIDRIDVDPFSARGIVQDYKSRQARPLGGADRARSCGSRSRSTCSCCATSSGSSRSAGSTGRSPASASRAGCCAPRRARRRCPGFAKSDYLDEEAFWARSSGARDRARRLARADPGGRRRATTRGRRVPDLVRPLADVPGASAHERARR